MVEGAGKKTTNFGLLELVDSLFYGYHRERTDFLSLIKHLNVECPQTGVVEPPAKYSKVVTHEQLVHSMTA